ncbi:hypothetical protein DFJ73DRAFT_962328 [Zopfochytrium polystomum]|nr:hypothetical protein DFJ73DRAFT_962328 [Zopfochytrium polystomum]
MTKNKGKQPAADAQGPQGGRSPGTALSYRLPETNSTPSGSVIAAASPAAPTAAPQLTAENVSPTSAFVTAGTLTHQSTAPEGRSTTVVPTIPPARGPRARGAPPVSLMGANLAVAPVRFTHAEVRQQLQQQGAVANNRAVNQQYYSLQQRAAEYASARRTGACNTAACRVATPAATPAPVVPVAAAPTSVVPAAVLTSVNAPGTTPMDVDHRCHSRPLRFLPIESLPSDLERVVVQTATVPPCPGRAAISHPIADGFVQLNTKLQGIEEFKALARSAPTTTEVFARTFTPAATPASSTPAAVTPVPSTPAEHGHLSWSLNDMQWARFFNDMGTPTPEEIALSSVYSVPGNNALINALSDIFEGSASSPVTPTALAGCCCSYGVGACPLTLTRIRLRVLSFLLSVLEVGLPASAEAGSDTRRRTIVTLGDATVVAIADETFPDRPGIVIDADGDDDESGLPQRGFFQLEARVFVFTRHSALTDDISTDGHFALLSTTGGYCQAILPESALEQYIVGQLSIDLDELMPASLVAHSPEWIDWLFAHLPRDWPGAPVLTSPGETDTLDITTALKDLDGTYTMSTFMHLGIHINFETAVDELFEPIHFYLEAIDADVVFLPWEGKFVRPGVGIVTQGSPSELRLYRYFRAVYPDLPAVPRVTDNWATQVASIPSFRTAAERPFPIPSRVERFTVPTESRRPRVLPDPSAFVHPRPRVRLSSMSSEVPTSDTTSRPRSSPSARFDAEAARTAAARAALARANAARAEIAEAAAREAASHRSAEHAALVRQEAERAAAAHSTSLRDAADTARRSRLAAREAEAAWAEEYHRRAATVAPSTAARVPAAHAASPTRPPIETLYRRSLAPPHGAHVPYVSPPGVVSPRTPQTPVSVAPRRTPPMPSGVVPFLVLATGGPNRNIDYRVAKDMRKHHAIPPLLQSDRDTDIPSLLNFRSHVFSCLTRLVLQPVDASTYEPLFWDTGSFFEHMLNASTFPTAKGSQFFMRIRGSLSSFTWTTFKAMYDQHFGLDSETTIDSAFRDYTWSPSATSPAAALTDLELPQLAPANDLARRLNMLSLTNLPGRSEFNALRAEVDSLRGRSSAVRTERPATPLSRPRRTYTAEEETMYGSAPPPVMRETSLPRQRSQSRERSGSCHLCDKPGHFVSNCPELAAAKQAVKDKYVNASAPSPANASDPSFIEFPPPTGKQTGTPPV